MDTSKFIELLRAKIDEANRNVTEIEQFRLVGQRTFGYKANYYDEKQVENALLKLTQWQQVIQDVLKSYYHSDQHDNYTRFSKTVNRVKEGFDYKVEIPKEYRKGVAVLSGILESIDLMGEVSMDAREQSNAIPRSKKIFISHASKDKKFTHALILLLNTIGFREDEIFCSSEPGYWIKKGNFFEVIKEQFEHNDLYVIFIQSPRFYASPVSMNEMGAAWALHSEYYSFLTKDMEYDQMNAVVNNHEIACKVDNDDAKGRLNDWMVELLSYFGKQPIRDFSIWESNRDAFLKTVRRLSYKKVKQSPESTEQSTAKPALKKKDVFIYKKNGETVILTRILNSKQLDVIKVDTTSHDLGIQSEYVWLKKYYPKFKHPMQYLSMLETEQGEKVFDMFPITKEGTSKEIYFDISSFYKEPIEILMNENDRTTYKIQKLYRKNSEVCSGK